MIRLTAVYILAGLIFAAVAVLSAGDRTNPRRIRNAAFWGLLALSFLFGEQLGDFSNGLLVLALADFGGVWGLQGSASPKPPHRNSAGKAPPGAAMPCSCPLWSSRQSRWPARSC